MKSKIKLHTGEKQALVVQEFQSLMEIVKLAFGSEESKKPLPPPITTAEEAESRFAAVFL